MFNEDTNEMPYIIQMLIEIADFLSLSEYLSFDNKYRKTTKYLSHTLVSYIFNIFSILVKMAKTRIWLRSSRLQTQLIRKKQRLAK